MVGKERPIHKLKNGNSVVVKVTTKQPPTTSSLSSSSSSSALTNVIVKHEQILLSPTSSENSKTPTTPQCFSPCEQKAIINYDDNSETTSSNDKLDR